MNQVNIDSFIDFCDNYQIAEEGMLTNILASIQKIFARLVLFIESKLKGCKDSKLKSKLLSLLKRAKNGLSKCKSLNEKDPEMVQRLKDEAEEIQKEVDEATKYVYLSYLGIGDNIKKAIKDNDLESLRSIVGGIINRDPTFATTYYDEFMDYLRSNNVDITEDYKKSEYDTRDQIIDDRSKWDSDYFRMLVVWLMSNFSTKRIPHIKEVGKYVYKDKMTFGKDLKRNIDKDRKRKNRE